MLGDRLSSRTSHRFPLRIASTIAAKWRAAINGCENLRRAVFDSVKRKLAMTHAGLESENRERMLGTMEGCVLKNPRGFVMTLLSIYVPDVETGRALLYERVG